MLVFEELKNKYIEYNSSITEEVFNKILERAREFQNKICKELRPYDVFKNTFDHFQSNGFFWFGPIGHFSYGVDNNKGFESDAEIEVSDILGEESKFEVGKWYSFYWNWSSGYCIGKVCQVNTYEKTVIQFDNYTSNNSPGKLFTDGRAIDLAEIENIKELNLEEIQQYLPDNHPDKIVKPIEKWSVGSCVVFLQKYGCSNKGTIDVIKEFDYNSIASYLEKEGISPGYLDGELNNYLKWFATLSEAEEFSKSLLEPEKEDLNKYDSEGNLIKMKKYVKCDIQEQWDFVKTKYNQDACSSLFHENKYIDLTFPGNSYYNHELIEPYKLYTFQEWLDLNGYTFEDGVSNRFNIGDEVKVCSKSDDLKGHGFLDSSRDKVSPINGVAGFTGIIESLKEYAGTIYYGFNRFAPNGYISEDCLKLVKSCNAPQKPNEKFKVGDHVISLIDTPYGRKKGDLLLITGEDSYIIIDTNRTELFSDTIASDEVVRSLRKATQEEVSKVNPPKTKEFNRSWYVKVSSQAEWLMLCDYLEKMGEKVSRTDDVDFSVKGSWPYVIFNKTWQLKKEVPILPQKQLSDILPNYSKVDRNVYYEVETQEQYNEILDWLESNGEQVNRGYGIIYPWKYICFESGEWGLNTKVESQLSKAEFQFKSKLEKQPIKTGMGLRERISSNAYLPDSVSFRWEMQDYFSTQNSIIESNQESTKLLSFEEDDVVLFKTSGVKISNEQLIIND